MWWLNPYRPRFGVDWPCDALHSDRAVPLDWRVRLAMVVACVVKMGLLVGLGAPVGG
jgi:hypothetical protein